jgi:hypothetical protein
VVDQYRPQDKPDLLRMTAATEGEESARIVSFWLDRQPSAFTVYRRRSTGRAVAFMSWLCLNEVDRTYSALIQWSRRPGHTAKLTPAAAPTPT